LLSLIPISLMSWRLVTHTMYKLFIITNENNDNLLSQFLLCFAPCHVYSVTYSLLISVLLLQLSTQLTMKISLDPRVST
jgi:hypothetical protein